MQSVILRKNLQVGAYCTVTFDSCTHTVFLLVLKGNLRKMEGHIISYKNGKWLCKALKLVTIDILGKGNLKLKLALVIPFPSSQEALELLAVQSELM